MTTKIFGAPIDVIRESEFSTQTQRISINHELSAYIYHHLFTFSKATSKLVFDWLSVGTVNVFSFANLRGESALFNFVLCLAKSYEDESLTSLSLSLLLSSSLWIEASSAAPDAFLCSLNIVYDLDRTLCSSKILFGSTDDSPRDGGFNFVLSILHNLNQTILIYSVQESPDADIDEYCWIGRWKQSTIIDEELRPGACGQRLLHSTFITHIISDNITGTTVNDVSNV